jgi:Protein of unknown function (DUF4087)
MKRYLTGLSSVLIAAASAFAQEPQLEPSGSADFETRCGWFDNPTPGNFSLYDRDSEWVIGVQGGYQVEGDWEPPKFSSAQWVNTNVHYGYGCACLDVQVDRKASEILAIRNSHAKTLNACRQDPSLARWKELFE